MSDEIKKKLVRTTRRHRELRLKLYAAFLVVCMAAAVGVGASNGRKEQEAAARAASIEEDEAREAAAVSGEDAADNTQADAKDSTAGKEEADAKEDTDVADKAGADAKADIKEDIEELSAQVAAETEAYESGFDSIREMEEALQVREEILANSSVYPEQFIKDLERNPEIADFVKAYPTAEPKVTGGITPQEKPEDVPLFLQWDPRWGYVPYGSYNIGISGCGPTCLSMVLYSLTGDKTLTPDLMAERATKEGYYVEGAGTAWTFMTGICADYGVTAVQAAAPELAAIKEQLNAGNLIICSMSPGDFTDTGHFIVIRGITEDGALLVNDPFSRANSRKEWEYGTIAAQIKQLWYYEKGAD